MQPYTRNYSHHLCLGTYIGPSTRRPRDNQPRQPPQRPFKVVKRTEQTPEPTIQNESQTQPERLFFTQKPIPFNPTQLTLTQPAISAIRKIECTYRVLYRQSYQIPPLFPDYFRAETLNLPPIQNQYPLNHFDVKYRDRTQEWYTYAIKDYRKYGFCKYDELRRHIHTRFTQFTAAIDKYNMSILYAVDPHFALEYQYLNQKDPNLDWTKIAELRSKTTIYTDSFLYVLIFLRRIMLVLNPGENTPEIGLILGILRVANPYTHTLLPEDHTSNQTFGWLFGRHSQILSS